MACRRKPVLPCSNGMLGKKKITSLYLFRNAEHVCENGDIMNSLEVTNSSPIDEKREQGYTITVGKDHIRGQRFIGTRSASKAIYDAAIKKILYDHKDNLQKFYKYCNANIWHIS